MSVLTEIIKAELAGRGIISFARFMELALYCPDYGFYERESDTVGRGGDFYTSVSVGPLLGELLAFQFADWLPQLKGDTFQIVEAGAHDGKLAADILRWLRQQRPAVAERVEYVIAEPSLRRREWQQKTLAEFGAQVRWTELNDATAARQSTGVIFANELLDALPVHRMGWDARQKTWFEWGVTWQDGQFIWARLPSSVTSPPVEKLPDELMEVLPDGFMTEVSPTAETWWAMAAQTLKAGRLMTLDYGLRAEEFFMPQRSAGTLRAYRRHQLQPDVLAQPGTQDITAHVNFSRIQSAGEKAGLQTESFASQAEILTGIFKRFWREAEGQGNWSPARNRELQTLIHPEHLGRAFRVLVQVR